jgi:beta-lactam-binding protein with PASTA domain
MARHVPADLEDALAANPAARERFWAMPAEQKDRWVDWIERSRFPGQRRRRVAETVSRLGGPVAAETAVEAAPVPVPNDNWAFWLIGLAILAGLVALILWLTVFRDSNDKGGSVVITQKATVPKVTGLRFQAAQFQLKEAKLGSKLKRENASKPKGIVVSQAPSAGATVQQGSVVDLVVSNGPPGVAMPDVVGLAAADAVKALQERQLQPTLRQVASKEAPGTVLSQQPQAGKRAKPGTDVVLEVAKGNAATAVPDVSGKPQADAVAALEQAGLKAATTQVPSAQPKGTVVAQSPAAGEKVARGSSVRLNVSKGSTPSPTTTTAPATTATTTAPVTTTKPPSSGNDYTGMRLADAVQKIVQGRQQVIVVYVASTQPAGVVVSNAKAGSRERLQVSAGKTPKPATSVPDVTGEDAATAQQDLQAAGFTVVQADWPVSDAAQDGMVVFETPSGQAPAGSAIVVYIGKAGG